MCIFATQMLNFIKKYPMSILLAIIAINTYVIQSNLRESNKYYYQKNICSRYLTIRDGVKLSQYNLDLTTEENSASDKLGLPPLLIYKYCSKISKF